MKLTIPHWVIVALTVLQIAGPKVVDLVPDAAPYVSVEQQVVTLIIGVLALLSPSAFPPAAGKAPERGMVRLHAAVGIVILSGAALLACSLFQQVEPPIQDCAARVLSDAAKGMTVTQIVEDAGGPCSLDAASVIVMLLGSSDPAVTSTKAYAEAQRVQKALHP